MKKKNGKAVLRTLKVYAEDVRKLRALQGRYIAANGERYTQAQAFSRVLVLAEKQLKAGDENE